MNFTSPSTLNSPSSSNAVSMVSIALCGSSTSVASTMTSISATISGEIVTSLILIPSISEARLAFISSSNSSEFSSIMEAISDNVSASSLVMV